MYRCVRFQLRAKPLQETQLRRWAGQARWLWNRALHEQKTRYEAGQPYANYVAMAKWLTEYFYTTSEGVHQEPLHALKRQAARLRRYQRAVARKQKGSNNRKKAVNRLANLHRRIARQRTDWLHKRSTALARDHAVIAMEDLRVGAMSRSSAGTLETPGTNVKAKSGLNRAILDQGWGTFRNMLVYKLQANGGQLVLVPPAYSSQRCSACGFIHAENRKTQARFACVACGHQEHADVNAAKNILAAGHAVSACGGDVRRSARKCTSAAPVKQEPTEAPRRASRSAAGILVLPATRAAASG